MASYFKVLKTMMFIFFVLTLLHIPIMHMYKIHGNFANESGEKMSIIVSLGSLGFSKTKCTSTGMATDKIVLTCNTGVISNVTEFGINARFEDRDLCIRNHTGACANSLDNNRVLHDIQSNCLGK